MGRVAVLATCSLSQWALDYLGNMERIIESIRIAKEAGARYLCGTELNITGYGCGDHYHESDTEMHAWEALAAIMQHPATTDIMVDVGLPIKHKHVIYNCKLVFLNRKVLFIRPKMILANDGCMGYRETRWFTAWTKIRELEDYHLPSVIMEIDGQRSAPFGDGMIQTRDTTIGYDICEELWNPESCHIAQCLDGAEIISNCLGSLEEFGRPGIGYQMVQMATAKSGGCYLFANQKGCDGSQGYFAGDACIGFNGGILAHTKLHNLEEVSVITATVDLESIRHYKASIRSRCIHAAKSKAYPRTEVDFSIANENWWTTGIPSCDPVEPVIPTKVEQILDVPACWLWDYLRRSGKNGFLLPLTGDVDSSATAAIVFSMCHLVVEAVATGSESVLSDVRRLVGRSDYVPSSAQELCGHLVQTLNLETSSSSMLGSKDIVNKLSQQIGSCHLSMDLGDQVHTISSAFASLTSESTEKMTGSEKKQSKLALQNLESRLAMVATYFFAESGDTSSTRRNKLIVLTSSNADKCLAGSDAKYGKCCGDINLIGRFPKDDLVRFLQLAQKRLELPVLQHLIQHSDIDEQFTCTHLQAVQGCGPYSMFGRLWHMWKASKTASEVAEKVKEFYRSVSHCRQNTIGLPPVFYMPSMGPPDDSRPLIYPMTWPWQFQAIDQAVKEIGEMNSGSEKP